MKTKKKVSLKKKSEFIPTISLKDVGRTSHLSNTKDPNWMFRRHVARKKCSN